MPSIKSMGNSRLNEYFYSGYEGKVTLEWLQKELTQFFLTDKKNVSMVEALREFRQQWLLNCFWQKFCAKYSNSTCISHKLERLILKVDQEVIGMKTLFLLDEFKLDYGAAGFSKSTSVELNWQPKSSSNLHLFIGIEPNSWQDFEFPKKDSELPKQGLIKKLFSKKKIPQSEDTMMCFFAIKYRNSDAISDLVSQGFTDEKDLPSIMKDVKKHHLLVEGKKV